MAKYGIYIFNLRKDNGQIKSTDTMIGEVDMSSKAYAGLDVQQACEKRIKSELAAKNGLSFYEFDDVINLKCLAIEEDKNHVDSRVRDYICKHTSATPIKVSYNNDKKRTELLRDITVENAYIEAQRYAGGKDARRLHKYALREYQRDIVEKASRILEDKNEVLVNLSTRGGKSFVSLELAKAAGAKNVLILTPYPAAEGSFRGEIEEHEDFRGWTFYTKNEIKNDTKFEPQFNCVFLSFAMMDPAGEKEKIKNITDQVHFDIIICDETHTTSASCRSAEILNAIPHEKEIHLSGTPYNDLMSGRFGKDNTVTLDFIDLINWDKAHDRSVGFPDLRLKIVSNMKELNEKLVAAYPDAFTDDADFSFEKAFGDAKDHTHKRAKAFLQWIFKQGVFNEHKHYLMFVPSVATSKIATAVLKAMDTGFEIMGLNDEDIGSSYEKTINDFEARNDKTIIVTCAKCTTGVTLKRCDAIVMLRRVNSAETFVQILFRCMTPFAGKTKADLYELDSEACFKVIKEVVKVHSALYDKSDLQTCRELLGSVAIESWSGEKMEFETEVAEKFLEKVKSIPTYYNMEDVFDFSSLKLTKNEQLALLSHDFGKSDKAKAQYIVAQNENATGVKSKSYAKPQIAVQEIKDGHGEVSEKKDAQKVEQKLKQLLLNLDWEIILNDIHAFKDLLGNIPSSISGDEQLTSIYRKVLKANERSLANFIEEYWLTLEEGKKDPDLEMELVNKLSSLNDVDKRTPMRLVNRMLDKMGATEYDGSDILDPCVGTGSMLFAAHKRGWPKDQLIGTDTDDRFVKILNRLGYENVFVKNCLDDDYKEKISLRMRRGNEMNDLKIIMNPPYDKNLHLKILDKMTKDFPEAEIVNLSPVGWLQDPLAEYKKDSNFSKFKNIINNIENIEVIDSLSATKLFGGENNMNANTDLGIYHFIKGGKFDISKIKNKIIYRLTKENPNIFNGFPIYTYKNRITNNFVVCNKIMGQMKRGIKGSLILKDYGVFNNGVDSENRTLSQAKDARPNSVWGNIDEWPVVCFNTAEEAYNFYNCCRTKTYQFIIKSMIFDQNAPLSFVPYLGDYTHPWTDEMLYEYFKLAPEEISVIEEEMK